MLCMMSSGSATMWQQPLHNVSLVLPGNAPVSQDAREYLHEPDCEGWGNVPSVAGFGRHPAVRDAEKPCLSGGVLGTGVLSREPSVFHSC